MQDPDFRSYQEVADALDVSERTVRAWGLPTYKWGGTVRVRWSDVVACGRAAGRNHKKGGDNDMGD